MTVAEVETAAGVIAQRRGLLPAYRVDPHPGGRAPGLPPEARR